MRRAVKKQAEETAELLGRRHLAIKKMLDAENRAGAMELLEQCQSCAISLGKGIEASQGEGSATVALLEGYCELVYQIYEKVGRPVKVNSSQIHNALAKELIRIGSSIRQDIRVRREVVFLPYKASMWDSLESIWRAASQDPECDAYVIPIPYYEKNPDGSLGQMHYEGSLYPRDVPVIYYGDYPFAEREPDMIFIHNPYDEYNYLTSVHPFFYSKSLKRFTENLVYVPYFILEEPDLNSKEEMEHIANFCTCSGVIYGDRVIVQSEKMRQAYVNVLMKHLGGRGVRRRDLERKILGLGSPKTDKALGTKRDQVEIPMEWERIIRKADGSAKKVILYNTGLTGFLRHSSGYADKMRDVFRVFWEEREETALLWRPHPLLENTIKTMKPDVLEEYKKLVEEYQEGKWGIYDDSPDLNRAIAVCDGYYGDESSVARLCQDVGKVVMIQDVENLQR